MTLKKCPRYNNPELIVRKESRMFQCPACRFTFTEGYMRAFEDGIKYALNLIKQSKTELMILIGQKQEPVGKIGSVMSYV